METFKLVARLRKDMSKAHVKELRRSGFVPASLSSKDSSTPLEIKLHDLVELSRTEGGLHTLLDLQVEGNKKASGAAIVKAVQRDPVTRRVLHVDLQHVSLKDKVTASVPVEIVGDSRGERQGGVLEHVLSEVQVRALPTNLPSKLEMDSTAWAIGHVARAGEIPLPDGVELLTDPDTVVATLRPPHVHEEKPAPEIEVPAAAPGAETVEAETGAS